MTHLAPETDWLSEFADEDNARPRSTPAAPIPSASRRSEADELLLHDPPLSFQVEPERTARSTTTGRRTVLVPMVVLAAVSAAIGLLPSIWRHGNLPVVRRPALAEQALPTLPSAPPLAAEPGAPGARTADQVPEDPGPSVRAQVPEPASVPFRQAQGLGPRSLPASGSTPREIETAAVQDVLERYRAAFGTLSTGGIADFWPDADTPALASTFAQFQSLRLDFHSCGVELSAGGRATARCTGRATFVSKSGDRSVRVEPRAWSFGLSRVDDRWIIVNVESR